MATKLSRSRILLAAGALVAVIATAFCWRVWVAHQAVPVARKFHDTSYYLQVAKGGLFSSELWAGGRSPLLPLFIKFGAHDPERVRLLLVISSALSWVFLAFAVSRVVTSPLLKPLAAALVASLGLSEDVVFWNECILSESLSFSSAALCLAAVLMFHFQPARWLLPVALCSTVFGLSRDSNAYLLLMLAVPLAAGAFVLRRRRRLWWPPLALSLSFVFAFLLTDFSANHGQRWQYPLTNVLVSRILPDPVKVQKFVALGMPHWPGLRPGSPRRAYDSHPRFRPFHDWVTSSGKRAYVRYLLTYPRETLSEPSLEPMFGAPLTGYTPKRPPAAAPAFVESLWSRGSWRGRAIFCGVLVLAAVAWPRLRQSPLTAAGCMLALFVYPQALLIWHGDAMEIRRHGIQAAFQLQLALTLLLVGTIDSLLRALGERRFVNQTTGGPSAPPIAGLPSPELNGSVSPAAITKRVPQV